MLRFHKSKLKESSYPVSSLWSWRAALAPSPGVETPPCSSSEPNTESGSPPATPQYASDQCPAPKAKTQSYRLDSVQAGTNEELRDDCYMMEVT